MKRDMKQDRDSSRFTSSWSLGEQAYRAIQNDLVQHGARTIVEFGSGASTVRLSQDFPSATILSIESEASFCQKTRGQLAQGRGEGRVEVALRPLTWQRHSLGWFRSYHPGSFPRDVDAVLIDGPPIATRRGREACLYQVFQFARIGARIYLDDYCRDAEQKIVRNWLRAYPGALSYCATFPSEHQVAVFEKIGERPTPRMSVHNALDSVMQNSRHILGHVRRGTLGQVWP